MRVYYSSDKRKCAEMTYESQYLLDPKYMTKRDLQYYYRYYNNKNRGQCKRIVIVICCVCFFSYLFLDYNLKTNLLRLRNHFDFVARIDAAEDAVNGSGAPVYFVDTPGCRIPYFAVRDDSIEQYVYAPHDYVASTAAACQRKPLTRSNATGHELWANLNDAKELLAVYNVSGGWERVHCRYYALHADGGHAPAVPFQLTPQRPQRIASHVEWLCVECSCGMGAEAEPFYRDYHYFAANKTQTTPTAPSTGATVERVSVMLLGVGSLSHLNFLRQLKSSAAYVQSQLDHVELWGHNKVAEDGFANMVPLLTGLDTSELEMACLPAAAEGKANNSSLDRCPLVWRRYRDLGYRTALMEDSAQLSFGAHFTQPPADYWLQPLLAELERRSGQQRPANANSRPCPGGRRAIDVLLESVDKLVPLLLRGDFFTQIWSSTVGSQDDFNTAALLDKDLRRLLERLNAAGVINKTVIFLASDHGLRWGSFRQTYQGMMEERQPLLIMLHPPWFERQYPLALRNFRANARRLTSHYDLHATLLDLSDARGRLSDAQLRLRAAELNESIASDNVPRTISLFLPVPESRSCADAGLATQWCTCHQQEQLPTNDGRVQQVARLIVKRINARLRGHPECRMLHLHAIMRAVVAAPHRKIVHNIRTDYSSDYTLRIQTKPGLAEFETTVRMSGSGVRLTVPITRLNLYTSQSYCVDDAALKVFCYCPR